MPKITKELTAVEVKRITKPGRHSVGSVSGLMLAVKDTGARSWILRTTIAGRRRNIGLGPFPEISLAEARERGRAAKKMIGKGIDPVEQRRADRRALENGRMTFKKAAERCHASKSAEFRNAKHSKQWLSTLEHYAFPVIGDIPVEGIELRHILQVLEPIWTAKTETATRVRQRIETVLSWATVSGYRRGDNPARWRGHLDAVLPKPNKLKGVKHFEALPWQDIGAFMKDIRQRQGMAARALEFIILTACRSGEARYATWHEINLDDGVWTIPAARMKAGREHTVPLCEDAINSLKALPRFEGSEYVFTAARGGPLSDMAISAVCRRMKVAAVPHGFRSTFRDWCAENTSFSRELAEMALAHTISNKVEAAYRRGDLFVKRRRLMDSWGAYCNTIQKDNGGAVIPLGRTRG